MSDADWRLAGWNANYARGLADVEIGEARAVLVDTNGDGRELAFALEGRSSDGEWIELLNWDDVGGHHPVERVESGPPVLFGGGTGRPRERKTATYDGGDFSVRVNGNGWWLLLRTATEGQTADTPG
jgi:hypothetical protein